MSIKLNKIFLYLFLGLAFIWLFVPFSMALLWSLVDPSVSWSYPDIFPKKLSLQRWFDMWETTSLSTAMLNSYSLAPLEALVTIVLASPTAYAFAKIDFPGREVFKVLVLIPLVVPSFVIAIFFTSLLYSLHIYAKYPSILLGHVLLFMPYAVRILTVSFTQVNDDIVNAARDLGANPWAIFKVAYLPAIKPGILASLLIVFILSIEEFAVAFIVGSPDFTTIPTILYSFLGYNFIRSNAAVVSLVLVGPNVLLMLFLERLLQSANPQNMSGKG